jgi:hypothetical protein
MWKNEKTFISRIREICMLQRTKRNKNATEMIFLNAEREGLDNTQTTLFEKIDITTMNKSNRRKLQFSIKERVD